ncbi:MAG: ATP-binding protein [Lachnospiraceae bacterium]|nr:ATP-binding protein [Lachnospiraceae bacterium]
MQKLIVHKLGPIVNCELEINKFMIFTGPQASGKSTLAKCIFFFKNIKNIFFAEVIKAQMLFNLEDNDTLFMSLKNRFIRDIRANFLQTFGTTWYMDHSMNLKYYYAPDKMIQICLKESDSAPNFVWVEMSDSIHQFIYNIENLKEEEKEHSDIVRKLVNDFFEETKEIVYIPAGRSLITLLSLQLNYIYSSMDDIQKRSLDYCTQNYLERILQLKNFYTSNYRQLIEDQIHLTDKKIDKKFLDFMSALMKDILKGEYRNVMGEERLEISDNKYVKINFASSGQQEVLWILNVVFYYLLNQKKAYFIIEEPESHLYPDAQKKIAQFIAAAKENGNNILVTTHSPYILGEFNNLLYANNIREHVSQERLETIINRYQWLEFSNVSGYYLEKGTISSCLDESFCSIVNEVIDGASDDINSEFEQMLVLKGE